jgi:hypothetical protein
MEKGTDKAANSSVNPAADKVLEDALLEDALKDFRQSMHAWSDAAWSAPRTVPVTVVRRNWRLAAGWALGCVLATGTLGGGVYQRHHQQAMAKIKAEQEARQQQLAMQQHAREEDEDLLATVDSDISRAVPAAMEPLAQLMDESEDQ